MKKKEVTKTLLILLLGVLLLGVVTPATLYIIDVKDTEKVNFLTTDLFCEKLGIEKFTSKSLNPCYKELDVRHLDISKVTIQLEDKEVEVYRID